jgi:hypothetical protein
MATVMRQFTFSTPDTINANYTTTTGFNDISVGPVTISSGNTVTVTSGTTWAIL